MEGRRRIGFMAKFKSVFKRKDEAGPGSSNLSVPEREGGFVDSLELAVETKGSDLFRSVELDVEDKEGYFLETEQSTFEEKEKVLVRSWEREGEKLSGVLSSIEQKVDSFSDILNLMESTVEGKGSEDVSLVESTTGGKGGLNSQSETPTVHEKGGSSGLQKTQMAVDGKEGEGELALLKPSVFKKCKNRNGSKNGSSYNPDTKSLIGNVDSPIEESRVRFIILFLLMLMGVSFMIVWESPGSLQFSIIKDFKLTTLQFSLLYSVQSWPSIFCWTSRFLTQRCMGEKLGIIFFLVICSFGTLLYSMGSIISVFWILIVGRALFGFGGQMPRATTRYYLQHWFGGKEYSVVQALTKSVPTLGGGLVFLAAEPLKHTFDNIFFKRLALGATIAFTTMAIYITLTCAVLVAILSKGKVEMASQRNMIDKGRAEENGEETSKHGTHLKDEGLAVNSTWMEQEGLKVESDRATHLSHCKEPDTIESDIGEEHASHSPPSPDPMPELSEQAKYPLQFWVLSVSSSAFFISCNNFIPTSQDFFAEKYCMTGDAANTVVSMFFLGTTFLWPLIGWSVARKGQYLSFMAMASLGGFIAHFTFLFTHVNPFLPMVLLSLCNSMMLGSVWAAYKQIVPSTQHIGASDTAEIVKNAFYAAGALASGSIIDKYNYPGAEIFFSSLLGCSLAGCIAACILNRRSMESLDSRTISRTAPQTQEVKSYGVEGAEFPSEESKSPSAPPQREIKASTNVLEGTVRDMPLVTTSPLTRPGSDAPGHLRVPSSITLEMGLSKVSTSNHPYFFQQDPTPKEHGLVIREGIERQAIGRQTTRLLIPSSLISRLQDSQIRRVKAHSTERLDVTPRISFSTEQDLPSTSTYRSHRSPSPIFPRRQRITPEPTIGTPPAEPARPLIRRRSTSSDKDPSEPVYLYRCGLPNCQVCSQREKELRRTHDTVISIP